LERKNEYCGTLKERRRSDESNGADHYESSPWQGSRGDGA
jgi:hypothetical protein